MERFARSWRLTKQSYSVLMKDKELLLLPLLSGLCILVVILSFALPMNVLAEDFEPNNGHMAVLLLFYIVTYTVTIFFQAAIIAGASERMRGGDPTVGSALAAASKRIGPIIMWGIIAGTVGMLLKAIQERSEWVGRLIVGLLGAAWSLATFFIVPVLVMEERTVGDSFKRSWGIFKKTWGETVIGSGGIGFVSVLAFIPVVLIAGLLISAGAVVAGILIGLVGLCVVGIFFSALQAVYVAALYRYATHEEAPDGFAALDISGAWHAR